MRRVVDITRNLISEGNVVNTPAEPGESREPDETGGTAGLIDDAGAEGPASTAGTDPARPAVRQLRLVVTAPDYQEALRFYRDVLGLTELGAFSSPGGHVTILDAGRATLELADPSHAQYIDQVEVGRRVAGRIRVAFEVDDAPAATETLVGAGAALLAEPVRTPWNSVNSRLEGPAGLQLTLFTELGEITD